MRRTRKLILIGIGCAAIFMFGLVSIVLVAHLLANRDAVKTFLVSKVVQTTGGKVEYARLKLAVLPVPHLEVHDLHISPSQTMDLRARKLSFYPAILPALSGRIRIHRLSLVAPDLRITSGSRSKGTPSSAPGIPPVNPERALQQLLETTFGFLAGIDPGTTLRIRNGRATYAPQASAPIQVVDINAAFTNTQGRLSLIIRGTSNLAGHFECHAQADAGTHLASGEIDLQSLDMGTLLAHVSLPGDIGIKGNHGSLRLNFTVTGAATAQADFNLAIPVLDVMRGDRSLKLQTVAINGTLGSARDELHLAIDTLKTKEPALDLSAEATLARADDTGRPRLRLSATARQLDVALAGEVAQTIAGDLPGIRTAFRVARAGGLKDAVYTTAFEREEPGWRLQQMTARGHLSHGRVTLPGIQADLEEIDGDVTYAGQHVDFKAVSGRFQGITFADLAASIDWQQTAQLTIDTPSASVDTAIFYPWLTGFKGPDGAKSYIAGMTGRAQLSRLKITGSLKQPADWQLAITGTPEALRLTTPRAPFPITLSGGEITYVPGAERSSGVTVAFLDAVVVAGHHSQGIAHSPSLAVTVDGTLGQDATAWLRTVLPIPSILQISPPLNLSRLKVQWDGQAAFSLAGGLKTANGIALEANLDRSSNAWRIHRLYLSDGRSAATLSADWKGRAGELAFSGAISKAMADLLIATNQPLVGRIDGDFKAHIDQEHPQKTTFTGKLAGNGIDFQKILPVPVAVERFSLTGDGSRLTITDSKLSMAQTHLSVSGSVTRPAGVPRFDLNLDADRLDDDLLEHLLRKSDRSVPQTTQAASPSALLQSGTLHLRADQLHLGGFTWSPAAAVITISGRSTHVQVEKAMLCGIATSGELDVSPQGTTLDMEVAASDTPFDATANCLFPDRVSTDARYNLSGEIHMPRTNTDFARAVTGTLTFSSQNGRVNSSSLLMKILSVLNSTEILTGGNTDLRKRGYGYSKAQVNASIGNGQVHLKEILLDGNSLKITGEGKIELASKTADIYLLAAPLKTIDRIVDKLPVIGYLAGGSLISIPLRVHGKLNNLSVVPMSPSAVGKGLLDFMARTLKAPFKLVESAASLAKEKASTDMKKSATTQPAPQEE